MKVSYFKFFKGHLPEAHAYADDTLLYLSFQPDSAMSEADVVNALQRSIKDIRTWMIVDKLKLNDEKTELIVIGSRLQQARLILIELKIEQVRVTTVTSAKGLITWTNLSPG